MDKNDGAIVIHLPKEKELWVKRLTERDGITPSEYGRRLIDEDLEKRQKEYAFMKSLFETNH